MSQSTDATASAASSGTSNVLDALVEQVADKALQARLSREIELLRGSRRFGLVFDRHLPESVRLVGHPVRVGVKVALRDESSAAVWRVTGFADGERTIARLDGDGGDVSTDRLVVVREFGETVYPGLRSVDRLELAGPDDPWHVVVNGENFHVLQALRQTHRESVDLIYIDPPYNTGNDGWIYNDRYVDENDRAKSSKWLSFMERRLLVARQLLKPTGVMIVAIGDDEHHRLRMLLDQTFGADNFISDVVWQGGRKNDSRYVSNGADYMLIYAKSESALAEQGIRWREEKAGVHQVLEAGEKAWADADGDEAAATQAMRNWFRAQPKDSPVQAMSRNVYFLPDGRLSRDGDITWPGGGGPKYDVLHPKTGLPVPVPEPGWRFTTPAKMQEAIDDGRVVFREDHTKPISLKRPLEDTTGQVVMSVFDRQRTHAGRHLISVLRESRFPFPKDHEVLMRWIRLAAPKDAVVLDFFGGSGTTSEAVMRLNAEDGGTRQSILVTNNEVGARQAKELRKAGFHPGDDEWEAKGVFRYVAMPRISTVVTGKREDGSVYEDTVPANVDFLELTYLDPGTVRIGLEFEAIGPLLWLQAGAVGPRIDAEPDEGWALTPSYGVLFDIDALGPFAAAVSEAAKRERAPKLAFVVTDSETEFQRVGERLPIGIEMVRLYDGYLANYAVNHDGGAA